MQPLSTRLGKALALAVAFFASSNALAQADTTSCVVAHPEAASGATIAVEMSVINDGQPCGMQRHFGGNPATSLSVRARPASGTLSTAKGKVSYTPNPGFVGKDSFDVQWFGSGFGPNGASKNLRTRVEVTVRAAGDEPRAVDGEPGAKSAAPGR